MEQLGVPIVSAWGVGEVLDMRTFKALSSAPDSIEVSTIALVTYLEEG